MKKCINCGKENEDYAVFCAECGSKLETIIPVKSIVPKREPEPKYHYNKKKNNEKILIISIVFVICFLLFTLFNVIVCKNVIDVHSMPAIEKYQTFLLNDILNRNASYPEQNNTNKVEPTTIATTIQEETTTIAVTENNTVTQPVTEEDSNSNQHYKVNVGNSVLNFRSDKSTSSSIIKYIPNNTDLVITKVEDGWGYTTYSGKSGWVSMDYVEKVD